MWGGWSSMGGIAGEQTVGELLALATRRLAEARIPSPSDEARLLMAEVLGVSSAWIIAHPEARPPTDRARLYLDYLSRRCAHEPFAYIVGHKEFYGLDLEVTPSVLIPRPETELLVDHALDAATRLRALKARPLVAVDLGTGSGAIAIALASRRPDLRVIAVDSSRDALELAARNAAIHRVADRIDLRQGDLMAPVTERIDLLVANLPYIPTGELEHLMPDVREYEPREALDGGPSGTDIIRRALRESEGRMDAPAFLLFEIGFTQGLRLSREARRLHPGASVRVFRDYAGFERVLSIELQ